MTNRGGMTSLDSLRKQIDRLDEALLDVLSRRGKLVQSIGALKARQNESVFAPGRERDLLKRLKDKNRGPLTRDAVGAVFQEVVHACRNLQKEFSIAYLGPEATFTHQAALR